MKEYFFLLSSITSAMKGEKVLQKNGFRASVLRDSKANPYGCGYMIKAYGDINKMSELKIFTLDYLIRTFHRIHVINF